MKNYTVKISKSVLSLDAVQEFIHDESNGAQVLFVGTVRNKTKGNSVKYLEFESYELMALKEMEKICVKVLEQEGIGRIAIYHRVGKLNLGEVPVIIGVSAPHRKKAFEACQLAIDTLKQTVPIWKKEFFEDGEVWVSATP